LILSIRKTDLYGFERFPGVDLLDENGIVERKLVLLSQEIRHLGNRLVSRVRLRG
jgi:hypothetical protein